MSRQARKKSTTGIYHVMVRGINQQKIFHDDEDCHRYLEILHRIMQESEQRVLGYCLMGNHVHMLIADGDDNLSTFMKRLGTSYAGWYNWKYERTGHVFQNRFKSECVEDEAYLLTVIRYIHQNPVKTGIVPKPEKYRWSSCRAYYGEKEYPLSLTQTHLILGILSPEEQQAQKQFRKYMEEENHDECLEDNRRERVSDETARREMRLLLRGKPISSIQQMERPERNEILRQIKGIEGVSLRQIARITGIGLNTIYNAK